MTKLKCSNQEVCDFAPLESGEIRIEVGNGFDAAEIIFEGKVFVGSVGVFIGETEADEDARNFESVMHLRDEGDGTTLANEDGFFPESFFERALRDLKDGCVERGDPWFAGAEDIELALYGFRQKFADVFFDELCNNVRILVGNETRGKFREGFRRDDGLRALALIATPHAVQFESWARPELFDNREALFAEIARRTDGFFKCFFLPGQCIQRFAFGSGDFCDFIARKFLS
jgi:hypothetical protein